MMGVPGSMLLWAKRAAVVLVLALVSIVAPARAQDAEPVLVAPVEPARLEYTAAPGCSDEVTFHHAVATYMDNGADPFDPGSPVVLRVTLKKVRRGYRGSLQKVPAEGEPWPEEDWTGPTCEEVLREIARLAAMRMHGTPKAAAPAPAPEPPPPVEPPPTAALPKPPQDAVGSQVNRVAPPNAALRFSPASKPPPPMDLTVTLSTAFVITAGYTADVGPALQLGAGLRRDWFSIDLELRGVFPGKAIASAQLDPENPREPRSFDLSQLSGQRAAQIYRKVLEDEASPGIFWDQSIVSGFFGVGASVKFE